MDDAFAHLVQLSGAAPDPGRQWLLKAVKTVPVLHGGRVCLHAASGRCGSERLEMFGIFAILNVSTVGGEE